MDGRFEETAVWKKGLLRRDCCFKEMVVLKKRSYEEDKTCKERRKDNDSGFY